MTGLGIDLTHRCNLNCDFCWKFVKQSDYEMTMQQVDNFCKYFGHLKPRLLRITGGEPLMHPQFMEILLKLRDVFSQSIMQVVTNAILLKQDMLMSHVRYVVTPYDANKNCFDNLGLKPYPRPHGYYDRNHDPDLSDKRARAIHARCLYKQIRIIGDNIYDCCHAETMERLRGCQIVHTKVEKDWEEKFDSVERWPECIHCFVGDGGRKI